MPLSELIFQWQLWPFMHWALIWTNPISVIFFSLLLSYVSIFSFTILVKVEIFLLKIVAFNPFLRLSATPSTKYLILFGLSKSFFYIVVSILFSHGSRHARITDAKVFFGYFQQFLSPFSFHHRDIRLVANRTHRSLWFSPCARSQRHDQWPPCSTNSA